MSNLAVIFDYGGNSLTLQCKSNEVIDDVLRRFCVKAQLDINDVTFYYNSQVIKLSGKTLEALGVKNLFKFSVVGKSVTVA